jgi:hypothetical protein
MQFHWPPDARRPSDADAAFREKKLDGSITSADLFLPPPNHAAERAVHRLSQPHDQPYEPNNQTAVFRLAECFPPGSNFYMMMD